MTWQKALYLGIFFFLLAVFSLQLYPLSQEEIEALPDLSKAELIQIIMIYDQSLTDLEGEMKSLKESTNLREMDLDKRESYLDRIENILIMQTKSSDTQDELSDKLYQEAKKKRTLERILDWLGGFATGYSTNEIKQLLQ